MKRSPLYYATVCFFTLPFCALGVVYLAVFGVFLALVAWPVAPVAIYFALKKHRQIYAKGPVNPEAPGFVPNG